MASVQTPNYVSEWEEIENSGNDAVTEGEELTVNNTWYSCSKLKTDKSYHLLYIPVNDAINFKRLPGSEKENLVKKRRLSFEDQQFLSSDRAMEYLQEISNAVVCIVIERSSGPVYGTGFFVKVNDEVAIFTNSHSVRALSSGKGIDFDVVKESNVKIICFYDGEGSKPIERQVERMEFASPPDKNKGQDVLLERMKRELTGGDSTPSPSIDASKAAMEMLAMYFKRRDAFLDYVIIHMKPLEDENLASRFANIKALEMRSFTLLENFRNVSSFGLTDPSSSKYPRSLRLFSLSHPHFHSKRVSFGGMESSLSHVYFLNMAYGQNDTGMLGGKEPFLQHSVTTCPGSSGAPIFFYIYNHETCEVEMDKSVYFLHFFGVPAKENEGKLQGKAVSFSTIIKHLEQQKMHQDLESALKDVRNYKETP